MSEEKRNNLVIKEMIDVIQKMNEDYYKQYEKIFIEEINRLIQENIIQVYQLQPSLDWTNETTAVFNGGLSILQGQAFWDLKSRTEKAEARELFYRDEVAKLVIKLEKAIKVIDRMSSSEAFGICGRIDPELSERMTYGREALKNGRSL